MERPPGPDEPTRRMPPAGPGPVMREREVAAEEPSAVYELLDRIRSLRTALAFVGVLAAAALGVAVWALLSDQDGSDRQGVSRERVSDLEDRVDNAVTELRDRQEQLDERLTALEEQAGGEDSAVEQLQDDVTQLGDSVEELGQVLQDLEQRVDELEQRQAGGASP